jgi:hypothetical protein
MRSAERSRRHLKKLSSGGCHRHNIKVFVVFRAATAAIFRRGARLWCNSRQAVRSLFKILIGVAIKQESIKE